MLSRQVVFYPHRRNRDGSFDSICLNCFVTVATGKTEAELSEYDNRHVCEYSTLSQRAFDRRVLEGKTIPTSGRSETFVKEIQANMTADETIASV
jgi:hypothetical protein